MPLHPTAAKMIADAKASGRPNAHLLPVDEARANFEKDFSELPRPDIAVIRDFEIEVDGGTILARLYRPVAGGDPLALVVYFHGGGWLLGSVDSHDGTARRLALASGAAVLSAGYRRGPESRFPVAVNDAVAAVRWAAAHASELGADASRLAVAGDSAGGNLAAVAAALLRGDDTVRIRHQLLAYPVTTCDLDTGFDPAYEGIMLYRDELQWHQDNYLTGPQDAADPRVSPLAGDLAGLPPATVILAECDPIRPQGARYAQALREAGVEVSEQQYPGMLHGFFGLDMMWDESREAMDFAGARLSTALQPAAQ
jgi:acetyl esterase/lipase